VCHVYCLLEIHRLSSLTESHNTLKAFNGYGFKPYDVLPSFPITLEGKTINVEVEVFDAPLDYNLLLGHSWIDSMRAVVSTLFCVVRFPHQGKVIMVDQLAFFNSDTRTSNVPFIVKTPPGYENVSPLMGTFPIPPPNVPHPFVASINMISTYVQETPTSYDPWILPNPGDHLRYGNQMPLSHYCIWVKLRRHVRRNCHFLLSEDRQTSDPLKRRFT
jgi:hypothetical protein